MKRSLSLRKQLFLLMALLVLLQSLSLVISLFVSQVFLMLDAEAFRLFENTTATRAQTYNAYAGQMIGNMTQETGTLADAIQGYAAQEETAEDALYLDNGQYMEVALKGTETLLSLLRNNRISGAFFMLNGSNAHKDVERAHSGVYLRNSAVSSGQDNAGNYLLEVGPIDVSQQHKIPTSINWRLDVLTADGSDMDYYTSPIQAALDEPKAEIERYGYWSIPTDILGDGQQVVTYTMPLIARNGDPYGVVGIEISMVLFAQYYLPNTDLPYQNSFYSISCVSEEAINLQWNIPSGPIAQVYLKQGELMSLEQVQTTDLYQTHIEGLGAMYCAVEPLVMYSQNSPFYETSWSLVGFVPQSILHETSAGVRSVLITSIVLTTLGAFIAVFLLLYVTTRRISGLSKYVQSLSPHMDIHFSHTGIQEIDELTSAVEKLNRSVINASKTTSKILELTLMPLGGYEVSSELGSVVATEYIYRLLGIPLGTDISKAYWQEAYAALVARPAPGYEDIYRYMDSEGEEIWLRILQTQTETGCVGIVLNVTKDIEEHRRLAHELDYDALTHLYSRVAFKREVFRTIHGAPEAIGAMVFIDLDNLKYTNDTYGHDMGDRLIIRAAEIFRQFSTYGGIVSRISGDEFAVYLHGFERQEDAKKVIIDLFAQHADFSLQTPDGLLQKVRFSAGIAYYPTDSMDVSDLLKLSDYAMYEAKHNQKGSVFEFNSESYRENVYLLENRESINHLLDEKLIRFAFQPIVDLKTGEIYAYEALMRPLLDNFKSPLEILSVAAAQSKLGQLEHLVIMTVFQTIRDREAELGGKMVFINSIPSQALSAENHLALERQYAAFFDRVVVEITEAESNSPEHLQHKLDFFRKNGIKIAVDDFGSGYSNEIRILSLTPDVVKIDIELIANIDVNKDKQMLLSNLISFCKSKGIKMVAEGVERRGELAEIIRLGVDYVQGFYVGRPSFDISPIPDKVKKEILFLQGSTGGGEGREAPKASK